ncbi:glycosyl transferase family 64 protein [Nitzschia inconspicua]|uniref:Glycosyl transferase family 64 protein n=1 Tax=Nitzschia inconspicua TaxID=303405 RepID=A0A9K3LXA8_9STRA|nr:glycosyl transferase family 64 protein [Nitzschia inconspicua]
MKRPSATPSGSRSTGSGNDSAPLGSHNRISTNRRIYDSHCKHNVKPSSSRRFLTSHSVLLCVTSFVLGMIVRNNMVFVDTTKESLDPSRGAPGITVRRNSVVSQSSAEALPFSSENAAFAAIRDRAITHQQHCHSIGLSQAEDFQKLQLNNHTAHLPQSGIIQAIDNYVPDKEAYSYECELPPETECDETQFTVIFMAYNPDRLDKLLDQIKKMLTHPEFKSLVAECLIVWNGERHVDETPLGKELVNFGKSHALRISYPLTAGFPNDLMNRYHPRLEVKTKSIMYYDDDGPFYSFKATVAGFELWKRNSNAQIGAMARKLDLGERATDESKAILNGPGDRFFVSQCPKDELDYNYREFANFGARMVLPSGSFLHSNYLCFLWHPIFEEIRQYVKEHPVHPDDASVSMLISQLAGRAPKVYPRREPKKQESQEMELGRRRLMEGIDWDRKGGHGQKMNWGRLRGDAANSLARYFGSINSGSIGWCYGTEWQKGENCKPEFPRIGMLPWLKADHTPRDTCP